MKGCPIKRFEERLERERLVGPERREAIRRGVEARVDDAARFAKSSPFPDPEDLRASRPERRQPGSGRRRGGRRG